MTSPPLAPGCPWYDLRASLPPNVKWCEAPVCSYFMEPANTWSNLAYILVGLAVFFLAAGPARPNLRRSFGTAAIVMGTCSFVYHATNNFLTQVLDFFGMYVFIWLLLSENLRRIGWISASGHRMAYGGAVVLCTLFTPLWWRVGLPIQAIIFLLVLGIIATEFLAGRREASPPARGWFYFSLGLILAGAASSAVDVSRTLCNPDNHLLQGHAVWHVLTALSLLPAYFFYRRLPSASPVGAG